MTFDDAFTVLMQFEGGGVLHTSTNDLGGTTKYGISQAAYPKLDIAKLTEEQAKAISYTDYYVPSGAKDAPEELQYVIYDTGFNCGVATAKKIMEEVKDNPSIERYLFLRECYDDTIVEHRKNQLANLGGWENRNKNILLLHDKKLI